MSTVERLGSSDQPAWSALARSLGMPFLDPGYLRIVRDVCDGGAGGCAPAGGLAALGAWRGDRLVGVLPLARRRTSVQLFSLAHDPTPGCLVEDAAAARDLLDAALAVSGRRRFRVSVEDHGGSVAAAFLDASAHAGRSVWLRQTGARLQIDIPESFDFYHASLGRRLRKELRRSERHLRGLGELSFSARTTGAGLDRFVEEAWAVEASGWKGETGTAIAMTPRLDRFYRRLAWWAATEGILFATEMRLDGRLVAFDLALRSGPRLWFTKGGFDDEFAKASPGHLMLQEGLRIGVERGVRTFDLMGGAEDYKRRWANHEAHGAILDAFAGGLTGRAQLAAAKGVRRAAHRGRAVREAAPVAVSWVGGRIARSG